MEYRKEEGKTNEPLHEKNRFFAYAKSKAQMSFAVTAKPISAFVSATWIVQSLYFQNPNFKPLTIFCGSSARFVSYLVGNPEDWFSHNEAQILLTCTNLHFYCPSKLKVKCTKFLQNISSVWTDMDSQSCRENKNPS